MQSELLFLKKKCEGEQTTCKARQTEQRGVVRSFTSSALLFACGRCRRGIFSLVLFHEPLNELLHGHQLADINEVEFLFGGGGRMRSGSTGRSGAARAQAQAGHTWTK